MQCTEYHAHTYVDVCIGQHVVSGVEVQQIALNDQQAQEPRVPNRHDVFLYVWKNEYRTLVRHVIVDEARAVYV